MPTMSDAIHEPDPEPYDIPRGTCPACGSGNVRHHVIGMPTHPESMETAPAWVEFEGCIHPGFTRSCRVCGLHWTDDEDDEL